MNKKMRTFPGFTLLELLAVIAIIAILATIAAVGIANAVKRGRDSVRESSMRDVKTALELYHQDNGSYPTSGGSAESWDTDIKQLRDGGYLKTIPHDPLSNNPIGKYTYVTDGQDYLLNTTLEYNKTKITLQGVTCGTASTDITNKGNGVTGTSNPDTRCFRLTND